MKEDYPHLHFRKDWDVSTDLAFELGQCHAIIEAISKVPLLPEFRKSLLELSLTTGAQATTAIEGNTLSLDEVRRVYEGKALLRAKSTRSRKSGIFLLASTRFSARQCPVIGWTRLRRDY